MESFQHPSVPETLLFLSQSLKYDIRPLYKFVGMSDCFGQSPFYVNALTQHRQCDAVYILCPPQL